MLDRASGSRRPTPKFRWVLSAILGGTLGSPFIFSGCGPAKREIASPPILASSSASTPVIVSAAETPPRGRLPRAVVPTRYALSLDVDPSKKSYRGVVSIDVTLDAPRKILWLHGKKLRVSAVDVKFAHVASEIAGASTEDHLSGTYREVETDGIARIDLPRELPAGRATLQLTFEADFGSALHGLYQLQVPGPDKKAPADFYAFTQLEAISAREMFPCFDEPSFKTQFSLTLNVPTGLAAIANTRQISRKKLPGDVEEVRFADTEPLPTYLLAIAVGPLDIVEAKPIAANELRSKPLPLRGVAARGRGGKLQYALSHAGELLQILERWTGYGYPYDKLDLIAVPDRDGAMENPGAITFHEYLLLFDEKTAPRSQKDAYAYVLAHELAHMWFGDLVTMPWWDDVWLNESFATFLGHRVVSLWDPSTHADRRLLDQIHEAMTTDSLASARSIRQPIESQHDIDNAFDSITYQKGAGVLAMFERFVGTKAYQRGLQKYLRDHAHGTATADDLLNAIGSEAGRDIRVPFRSFLDQPGVPFVETKLSCVGTHKTVEVSQSRFFPLGSKGEAARTWGIPLCIRYFDGAIRERCELVNTPTAVVTLPEGTRCPDWAFANADASGYYRLGLSAEELTKLRGRGNYEVLSSREQAALADAIRAAFSRGSLTFEAYLAAVSPFAQSPSVGLFSEALRPFELAQSWFENDAPSRDNLELQARKVFLPRWKTLGTSAKRGEDPEQTTLRERMYRFLLFVARDPAVRAEAIVAARIQLGLSIEGMTTEPRFGRPKPQPTFDAGLQGMQLLVLAETGDLAVYNHVEARLMSTTDPLVRARLLSALGSFRDPVLASRARELSFDVRLQTGEVLSVVWQQLSEPTTRESAWEFVKKRFDDIVKRTSAERAGGLPWAGGSFCDEAHEKDVAAFFGPVEKTLEGGPRNLASVLERIHLCVAKKTAHLVSARTAFAKKP